MQTEREFLHDIASPLAIISLNLEFAMKQYRDKFDNDAMWKHVETASNEVERLIAMADKRHGEVRQK